MAQLIIPSSSSSSAAGSGSRVVHAIPAAALGALSSALPVGREALRLLGGRVAEAAATAKTGSEFPEDKINIPVGITPQTLSKYTLYDVLGFAGEWGAAADTDAIKKAYHKAVLMYHPDKAQFKTADGKEDRSVFLKIQEAFNVLSNETKRRAYDSQLPFDESIPTEEKVQKALAKGPHKFFKLFAPVFQRNARFAVNKPVPDLGDMNTAVDDVYRFYEYWVNFESWRDFTGVGAEHRPEDASSREEKRWMMKENERLAKKLKKKEMERLIQLVTIAEKYDPRINAEKERRRAEKEAEKKAKEDAALRKMEEEAAAKAWAEAQESAPAAVAELSKAEKEKLKKAQSKARNILRKLLRQSAEMGHGQGEYGIVSAADVELVCAHCSVEDIAEINASLGGEPATKDSALYTISGFDVVQRKVARAKLTQEQAQEDERIAREAKKREAEEKAAAERRGKGAVATERSWTEEELLMLQTCLERYAAGTPDRWTLVCNYLNVYSKPTDWFQREEVVLAAYRLSVSGEKLA